MSNVQIGHKKSLEFKYFYLLGAPSTKNYLFGILSGGKYKLLTFMHCEFAFFYNQSLNASRSLNEGMLTFGATC